MHANTDCGISMPAVNTSRTDLLCSVEHVGRSNTDRSFSEKVSGLFEHRNSASQQLSCCLPEISEFLSEEWLHKPQYCELVPGRNTADTLGRKTNVPSQSQHLDVTKQPEKTCNASHSPWFATSCTHESKFVHHYVSEVSSSCRTSSERFHYRHFCCDRCPQRSKEDHRKRNLVVDANRPCRSNANGCSSFLPSSACQGNGSILSRSLSMSVDVTYNKYSDDMLDNFQNRYGTFSEMLNDDFPSVTPTNQAPCSNQAETCKSCFTNQNKEEKFELISVPFAGSLDKNVTKKQEAQGSCKPDPSLHIPDHPLESKPHLGFVEPTTLVSDYSHTASGDQSLHDKMLFSNTGWPAPESKKPESHNESDLGENAPSFYQTQTLATFCLGETPFISDAEHAAAPEISSSQNENIIFEDIDLSAVDRSCMEQLEREYKKEAIKEVKFACSLLNLNPDPHEWDEGQVRKWILWTSHQCHLPAVDTAQFCMTGKELCSLSENQMRCLAPRCGDILHAKLDVWRSVSKINSTDVEKEIFDGAEQEQNHLKLLRTDISEKDNEPASYLATNDESTKKFSESSEPSGIQRSSPCKETTISAMTPNHINGIHLWQFLKELLLQPVKYGQYIRWMDREQGIFKIEDSVEVAKLWGIRKKRPAMNYDKLSRSIRQYYKKGIIRKPRISQRLVYQFVKPLM